LDCGRVGRNGRPGRQASGRRGVDVDDLDRGLGGQDGCLEAAAVFLPYVPTNQSLAVDSHAEPEQCGRVRPVASRIVGQPSPGPMLPMCQMRQKYGEGINSVSFGRPRATMKR
jgi:hypothetical protein